MGFLDHLEELRTRLIRSCIAIVAGMAVAALFVDRIKTFVLAPVQAHLPPGTSLVMTGLGEGFAFYLDLTLIGGAILATPFVTYQVWRFVSPGLHASEKRLVAPFIALATGATVAGAAFSHYMLFPSMVSFFASFDSPEAHLMPQLTDTFGLYKDTLLAMVIVFQLPTLAFVLARTGLVTARFLRQHIPYAVLASFIVSAVLTPSTDPWNQILFAVPVMALYIVSIAVAWIAAPRHPDGHGLGPPLKLVFAAAAVNEAWRRRERGPFPRRVNQRA